MNNKKVGLILTILTLGVPVTSTLINPSKSEAFIKTSSGAVKSTSSVSNAIRPINITTTINKFKNLKIPPTINASTSTTTTGSPSRGHIQSLIHGLNKSVNGSSSTSSTTGTSGKLNLNSDFKSKLNGLLGSGNPNFASSKSPLKSQNQSVGKLSSEAKNSISSLIGMKPVPSSSSTIQSAGEAYVNPSAPVAPPLTLTPTTSSPAPIPNAPPLPTAATKPLPYSSTRPTAKVTTSSTSSTPSISSVKTTIKPTTGPAGYENMLSELKGKLSSRKQ